MRVHRSKYRRLALAVLAGGTLSLVAFTTVAGLEPLTESARQQARPRDRRDEERQGRLEERDQDRLELRDQGVRRQPCDGRYAPRRSAGVDSATMLVKWFNENVQFPGGRKLAVQS